MDAYLINRRATTDPAIFPSSRSETASIPVSSGRRKVPTKVSSLATTRPHEGFARVGEDPRPTPSTVEAPYLVNGCRNARSNAAGHHPCTRNPIPTSVVQRAGTVVPGDCLHSNPLDSRTLRSRASGFTPAADADDQD